MNSKLAIDLPDGDWTCSWIGNYYFKKTEKDISVRVRISYTSKSGTQKTISVPIYNLFMTIIGSQIRVMNSIIVGFISNAQQYPGVYHIFLIEGKPLTSISKRLYEQLDLSGFEYSVAKQSPEFAAAVLQKIGLPDTFGLSHGHRIPNLAKSATNTIDYFLIPSTELLRYYFLHGHLLDRDLLSHFTGKPEKDSWSIDSLFIHPTGKPEIKWDDQTRLAPLFLKEGLTDAEIHCLARIAFIPQAYDCLELVRDSILSNLMEYGDYSYGRLATMFPQDTPFQLSVFGKEFTWQGKNYLLVNQIYSTEEQLPFDQVVYMPLIDHRSQAVLAPQTKDSSSVTARRTTPTADHTRSDSESGNADQPARLLDFLQVGHSFNQPLSQPVKLPKTGQTTRYRTVALEEVAQQLISLVEQAQAQSDAGRARQHRLDVLHRSPSDQEPQALFNALRQLQDYRCTYFNLAAEFPSFAQKFCLNYHRGLTRPFDILLCQFESTVPGVRGKAYLVWANDIRYGMFYAPSLTEIEPDALVRLCNNSFGLKGVYAFGNRPPYAYPKPLMRNYQLRNQLRKSAADLTDKIAGELRGIFEDQAGAGGSKPGYRRN